MLRFFDDVASYTSSSGLGDLTVGEKAASRGIPDVLADGEKAVATIRTADGAHREVTVITYNQSAGTVSRADAPRVGTNGGAKVNFPAGVTKIIELVCSVEDIFIQSAVIEPDEITADQNDYAPAGLARASWLLLTSDDDWVITGIAAGNDGDLKHITNAGDHTLTLPVENAGSAAANRFKWPSDVTLRTGESVTLRYDAAAARWRVFGGGTASGNFVQRVEATSAAMTTHTANIPVDDSKPQSDEGDQLLTVAITPRAAGNRLRVSFSSSVHAVSVTGAHAVFALFNDSAGSALAVIANTTPQANDFISCNMVFELDAPDTSEITFKIRGGPSAGTLTINGTSGARLFGGAALIRLAVEEFKAA